MTIGIDGNMWYVSNGLCLGEPSSSYAFAPTLRMALKEYNKYTVRGANMRECPEELRAFLDSSPDEYRSKMDESIGEKVK